MKNERPRYMPDAAQVLKDCDPTTFDERQGKALERVRDAGLLERLTPEPAGRVSAPSPWAKDGGGADGVDKAALPSARVPAAASTPAEERPVTKAAAPVKPARRWPVSWIVVMGCIGVGLTAMLTAVLVMLGRTTEPKASAPTESAMATVDAVPSATVIPRTAATAKAPALPVAPSTPSATTIPAPSAPPRKLPSKVHAPPEEPHAAVPPAPVKAPQAPPSAPPEPPPSPKIIE
jgi:hypothetical protein